MIISENIVSQWPNFEDGTVYLIEKKTHSIRPKPFTIFYSTGPYMASWSEYDQAFRLHHTDSFAYKSDVVDVRDITMDTNYIWNTSGNPDLKEWPD